MTTAEIDIKEYTCKHKIRFPKVIWNFEIVVQERESNHKTQQIKIS